MPKIFISYRRSASAGHAGRIYDRLIAEYDENNVFLDVEEIPAGETFSSYLLAKIDASNVFLLMLGEDTLDRCDDPEDWVRREIAYALQKPELVLIPVLQDGYKMPPPESLPEDIRDITGKNAGFLFHQMFDESVSKLINSINQLFPEPSISDNIATQVNTPSAPPSPTRTGKIRIHRVPNTVVYRIRPFTIKVDGQDKQQISNGETVVFDVPTGQHTLSVHVDLHKPEHYINISEDEELNFEVQVRNFGMSVTLEPR